MKAFLQILFTGLLFISFTGCEGPMGPQGENGKDGIDANGTGYPQEIIGTWIKDDESLSTEYLLIQEDKSPLNLIEFQNGARKKYSLDHITQISLISGTYKITDDTLILYGEHNGVNIDIKYIKTVDISLSTWITDIELSLNSIFALEYNNMKYGSLSWVGNELWARGTNNGGNIYQLNPSDYSYIGQKEGYNPTYSNVLSTINKQLLLVNGDAYSDVDSLIMVDPSTGDIVNSIDVPLKYDEIVALCVHNDTIWYFDTYGGYDDDGVITAIDTLGNILESHELSQFSVRDIIFVNSTMYILDNNDYIHKFNRETEKFTKTYNFFYNFDGSSDINGISINGDNLIIEDGPNTNIISSSVLL